MISHEDHDMIAPMIETLIASFPLLLNSSFTPPKTYISAQIRIMMRLMYPTRASALLVILIMMHGISSKWRFHVRRLFASTQLPSKIDFGGLAARLI
jgi:hypothetical protein